MVGTLAPAQDHPRSRGVYRFHHFVTIDGSGSSPLARGLPWAHESDFDTAGIIPARAGFTWRNKAHIGNMEDHPRSRGVYGDVHVADLSGVGSSPLARGLPAGDLYSVGLQRIIPARAGFTPMRCRPIRGSWDHPRSRGVYADAQRDGRGRPGSSPLARGLRLGWVRGLMSRRIIPARAGFTDGTLARNISFRGSSPLARGLQGIGRFLARGKGIIPARAGFTRRLPESRREWWDHPRSRGVYPLRTFSWWLIRGSSPLARGLLYLDRRVLLRRRIIPARAGFTLADPWNPNEPVLYQTPVAFTADLGPARRVVVAPPRQE